LDSTGSDYLLEDSSIERGGEVVMVLTAAFDGG